MTTHPNTTCATFDYDVLVVGSGPMGATTTLALATYGVRVHMVSKWNWLADTPRAHITNQRAMEVLRDLGLEEEVRRAATPWEQMGDTLFTTSLAGEEICRLRTWGTGDERHGDYVQGSPCPLVDLTQPKMEPILVTNAAARGASMAFHTEYLRHEQDEAGVTVWLLDRLQQREYTLRVKYLVGADGAKSKIAEDINLPIEGQLARAGTAYVIFRADLSRYTAHRPSILYWIVSPSATFGEIGLGLLRCVEPWHTWIAGWGYDISKGEPDFSEATVKEKIRVLVGDSNLEPEIERCSTWYVNQAHATTYQQGRVLCGGDAVHRHPPSSGLGSNTCMQDAFNLAWKLAYVVKGYAGAGLLDSYSLERAPVGQQIVQRANQSRLDYAPLNACFRAPEAANPVLAGLERLREPSPEGVQVRTTLQQALALKNTEFNAQGVELNQRYTSAAVLADASPPEVWPRDPQLYLQTTTRPGAKLPHAWLVNAQGRRISTLDVVGHGRFTLLTGLAGQAWAQAVTALNLPYLQCVVVGEKDHADLYYAWQQVRDMDEAGALLVRPDGYIAWRQQAAVWQAATAEALVREALAAVLAHATR